MKILFHAMEPETLARFIETKEDIMSAALRMTAEERIAARAEIMQAARVYDVPEGGGVAADFYSIDAEGVASIPVRGKLTSTVDVCDGFFSDVTTYAFIAAAVQAAENDPAVRKVALCFSTGGGSIVGLDACARVIAGCDKPTEARVAGMCASAGYWLASQCDRVVATSPTDFIGSIGVAMELVDTRDADKARGVRRIVLTSTDAPDKRPDIATEEGQKKYVQELDALHGVFVSRVAEGRGVPPETVNSDFGKGGVLIAAAAMSAGMIDAVEGQKMDRKPMMQTPAVAEGNPTREEKKMATLAELLATDPAAKAEHDKIVADARADGQKLVEARVAAAKPYLADGAYPGPVRETAVKVITGEAPESTLMAVVAAVDAVREKEKSDAAAEKTGETPATPAAPAPETQIDPGAVISDDNGLAAAIARAKGKGE